MEITSEKSEQLKQGENGRENIKRILEDQFMPSNMQLIEIPE